MTALLTDINPHEDGVRCGECEGPLYVKECDCCKPRMVCHDRMLDGKTHEFVRGPECLAAANRAAAKDAEIARLRGALATAQVLAYSHEQGEWGLRLRFERAEAERDALREIIGRIHDVIGESRASDDDTLPDAVAAIKRAVVTARARAEAAESRLLTVERERDALIEADRRHLGYYHKLVMDRNALKTERDALLEMATTRPEDQFDHATGDTFDTSAQCPMHGAATNAADAPEVKP